MKFTDDEKRAFADLLVTARDASGWRGPSLVTALAERGFTVSTQTISNWETAKSVPERFELVLALEDIYNLHGHLLAALNVPGAKPIRKRHLSAAGEGGDPGPEPKGKRGRGRPNPPGES